MIEMANALTDWNLLWRKAFAELTCFRMLANVDSEWKKKLADEVQMMMTMTSVKMKWKVVVAAMTNLNSQLAASQAVADT